MKSLLFLEDTDIGAVTIVLPKVREVYKGLGNVIITFDNGDRRSIHAKSANEMIKTINNALENYYSK